MSSQLSLKDNDVPLLRVSSLQAPDRYTITMISRSPFAPCPSRISHRSCVVSSCIRSSRSPAASKRLRAGWLPPAPPLSRPTPKRPRERRRLQLHQILAQPRREQEVAIRLNPPLLHLLDDQ